MYIMLLGATALVYKNDPYFLKKQKEMEKVKTNDSCNYGVPLGYRCRNCDTQFNSQTPAAQYQRQKVIQGAVRVASSLYTMNIGSLTAYQKPTAVTQDVCWNQMSDRREPHVQRNVIATGVTKATQSMISGNGQRTTGPPMSQPQPLPCSEKHLTLFATHTAGTGRCHSTNQRCLGVR